MSPFAYALFGVIDQTLSDTVAVPFQYCCSSIFSQMELYSITAGMNHTAHNVKGT